MPLPVGVLGDTPEPPPVGGAPPPERLRLTWIAPDGVEHELATPQQTGINALSTNALASSAPIELTTDDNPRGGVTVRHIQPLGKHLILPLHVKGTNQADFVTRWRNLEDAFSQTQDYGPGTLRVQRPDGTRREIEAWYESGWDGEPDHGVGVNWDNAVITLLAESPYWRDPAPVTVRRAFGAAQDFYDPYASISSSQVLGETTITNPGKVRAWPVWRLYGPMSEFTATLQDTGEEFSFDPTWDGGTLGLGDTATIVTDPVQVRGPAGEVWTGAIDFPAGVLWALRRGANRVNFVAAGADEGTAVEMEFHPLYRTA